MHNFRELFTLDEVCLALDIDDFSASELLDGTIAFTTREVLLLAKLKKITVNSLLKFEFDDDNIEIEI